MGNFCGAACTARYERELALDDSFIGDVNGRTAGPKDGDPRAAQPGTVSAPATDPSCEPETPASARPRGSRSPETLTPPLTPSTGAPSTARTASAGQPLADTTRAPLSSAPVTVGNPATAAALPPAAVAGTPSEAGCAPIVRAVAAAEYYRTYGVMPGWAV